MAADVQIERVQVCFNVRDPDQLALFERVCSRPNRSAYIKRLIDRDMRGGTVGSGPARATTRPANEDFSIEEFI